MYKVLQLLSDDQIAECRSIAASAQFVDGRITNPANTAKHNEQLHDPSVYQKSAKLLHGAMMASEDFRNFAFPTAIAPPLITRYQPGMRYGAHTDSAYINLPGGTLRSDVEDTLESQADLPDQAILE